MLAARAECMSTGSPIFPLFGTLRGRFTAAAVWLREACCGLGGHAMMLRFEPKRISLQCLSCGHNTPGWTISGPRLGLNHALTRRGSV